ncbi:MAG: S-layer homology domain-containing protein, partial [Chloroflexia bacterium]
YLAGIDAASSTDVWATGTHSDGNTARTLILHWDGSAWSVSPSPDEGVPGGIAVVSSTDVWIAGYHNVGVASHTLTARYAICVATPTPTSTSTPSVTPTSTSTVPATLIPTQTLTRTPTQTPVNTATTISTGSPTATNPPTLTSTLTTVPGTQTPASTLTPTPTSTRTLTPLTPTNTAIQTQTPGAPTATSTSTVPPTQVPTSTPTLQPTATATACSIMFTDVLPGSTFYDFVRCMACRGIINGYTSGCETGDPCFRPNNNVTRGQLSKIVANAAGFNEPTGAQKYEDVLPGSTFYDVIWRLAERGYVSGYPCGGDGEPCGTGNLPYFRPNGNATRGQISKIVSNAAGFSDPASSQLFEDVVPGSTFYDFIQRLVIHGVMSGYACGGPGEPCNPPGNRPYFRPANLATRGQTAKIVANSFFPGCATPTR